MISMDLRKLKTLVDLVSETNIAELEVTEGDSKVRITKNSSVQERPSLAVHSPAIATPASVAIPATSTSITEANPIVPEEPDGTVVKSPMVGTFYSASAPGNPPYVQVGSSVKAGDTLCIIEAMKLLNEIEAESDGTIKKILVENGSPVEFGQPLFIIG